MSVLDLFTGAWSTQIAMSVGSPTPITCLLLLYPQEEDGPGEGPHDPCDPHSLSRRSVSSQILKGLVRASKSVL